MERGGDVQYHAVHNDADTSASHDEGPSASTSDLNHSKSRSFQDPKLAPQEKIGNSHDLATTNTLYGGSHTELQAAYVEDGWWLEALSVLGSAIALAGVIALLAIYNNHEQPDWTHVSLNTVISWLSTISKALVFVSISHAIGQLKWSWFAARPQPLDALRTFDMASRGVSGSFELIWLTKGLHIALLGCFATILAVGFDPFVQNLIRYYPMSVPDAKQTANIANTSMFTALGTQRGGSFYSVNPAVKGNVYNSLFNSDPLEPWGVPHYDCTSGNCTWPPIVTLVAQPRCHDLSPMLNMQCDQKSNCSVGIDEGVSMYWWPAGGSHMNVSITAKPKIFTNTTMRYVFQYIMARNVTAVLDRDYTLNNDSDFVATECTLEFCAQKLQDSVSQSQYQRSLIGDPWCHANITGYDPNYFSLSPPWAPPEYTTISTSGKGEGQLKLDLHFGLERTAFESLVSFLGDIFSGSVYATSDVFDYLPGRSGSGAGVDVIEAVYLGNFSSCGLSDDHLTCAMNNVAKAVTKSFRDSAYITNGAAGANMTRGETMVIATYVHIQWVWITLPVAVLATGAALFITTAVITHHFGLPKWKNNVLPLLYLQQNHGRESKEWAFGTTNVAYFEKARQTTTQLIVNQDSARLI